MRYLFIIAFSLLFTSCGISVSNLPYSSQAVKETVSVCTEAAKDACTEKMQKVIGDNKNISENITVVSRAATSWDIHMMLW